MFIMEIYCLSKASIETLVFLLSFWLLVMWTSPVYKNIGNRETIQRQSQELLQVVYSNVFPITQAVEMAEDYNRQLWREIANR